VDRVRRWRSGNAVVGRNDGVGLLPNGVPKVLLLPGLREASGHVGDRSRLLVRVVGKLREEGFDGGVLHARVETRHVAERVWLLLLRRVLVLLLGDVGSSLVGLVENVGVHRRKTGCRGSGRVDHCRKRKRCSRDDGSRTVETKR
jgi:hypothetical protein